MPTENGALYSHILPKTIVNREYQATVKIKFSGEETACIVASLRYLHPCGHPWRANIVNVNSVCQRAQREWVNHFIRKKYKSSTCYKKNF
jgi:hypothetical protein